MLLPAVVWLHFTTQTGEVILRKDRISSVFSQTRGGKDCKDERGEVKRNEKGETLCLIEKFVCAEGVCHSVVWTDPFETLKVLVTKPDPEPPPDPCVTWVSP